ncbi:hypothetical protein [Rhizobium leguminosarum]|uniref:hypothetical protein n=1 Tax=Rhizobium leguminosarum TaxID=384 RepID=UPI0019822551
MSFARPSHRLDPCNAVNPLRALGLGARILQPAGDLASAPGRMLVADIKHRALEIGSGTPRVRMRAAGAVHHRLARPQAPQPLHAMFEALKSAGFQIDTVSVPQPDPVEVTVVPEPQTYEEEFVI